MGLTAWPRRWVRSPCPGRSVLREMRGSTAPWWSAWRPGGDAGAVVAPAPVVGPVTGVVADGLGVEPVEVVARPSRCACSAREARVRRRRPRPRCGHRGCVPVTWAPVASCRPVRKAAADGEDRRGRREDPACGRAVGTAPPALAHDLHLEAVGPPARAHEHDGVLGAGHGGRVEVGGDGRDDAQHRRAGDGADDAQARAQRRRGRGSHRPADQLGQGEVEQLDLDGVCGWAPAGAAVMRAAVMRVSVQVGVGQLLRHVPEGSVAVVVSHARRTGRRDR